MNNVEMIKKMYPRGARIYLDRMADDEPRPIPPGTKGTVSNVDDMGTIHVHWDNGRGLGLIPDADEFHKI